MIDQEVIEKARDTLNGLLIETERLLNLKVTILVGFRGSEVKVLSGIYQNTRAIWQEITTLEIDFPIEAMELFNRYRLLGIIPQGLSSDAIEGIRKEASLAMRILESVERDLQTQLIEIELPDQDRAVGLKINLAGQMDLDPQFGPVNAARIEALKPGLAQLINEALGYLNDTGGYFEYLREVLERYWAEIDKAPESIEFGLVFVAGTELEEALAEARQTNGGDNTPSLAPKHAAKISTVLKVHVNIMIASDLGAGLVAEKEISEETPEQARARRATIANLKDEVENSNGVFSEAAKPVLVAGLKGGNLEADIVARRIAKNIGLAAVGALAVSAGPTIGLLSVSWGVTVSIAAGVGLLFGGNHVAKAGAELGSDIPQSMRQGLARIRTFALEAREPLSKAIAVLDKGEWFKRVFNSVAGEVKDEADLERLKGLFGDTVYIVGFDTAETDIAKHAVIKLLELAVPALPKMKFVLGPLDKATLIEINGLKATMICGIHWRRNAEINVNDVLPHIRDDLIRPHIIFLKGGEKGQFIYYNSRREEVRRTYPYDNSKLAKLERHIRHRFLDHYLSFRGEF